LCPGSTRPSPSLWAESMEETREGVRRDLENELNLRRTKASACNWSRALLDRVSFELPETAVAQETRNVVYDIVRDNQKRGRVARADRAPEGADLHCRDARRQERVKAAFPDAENRRGRSRSRRPRRKFARRINNLAAYVSDPPRTNS